MKILPAGLRGNFSQVNLSDIITETDRKHGDAFANCLGNHVCKFIIFGVIVISVGKNDDRASFCGTGY